MSQASRWCFLLVLALGVLAVDAAEEKSGGRTGPISIARPKSSAQVDFERQILPILRPNCLPCHNRTAAKGGLNLETPEEMLRGGSSGPAIVPKKGSASLLLKTAAHQDPDTIMPPAGNKAQAMNLTPEQLGLVKLWIDQGARGTVSIARQIDWQPLADSVRSILGVAITEDGQFAACTRGNQVAVYHLPSSNLVAQLSDPALVKSGLYAHPDVAHRDLVNAIAFSRDGSRLATAGYREVKIWRRTADEPVSVLAGAARREVTCVAVSPDGAWFATGGDDGVARLWDRAKNKVTKTLTGAKSALRVLLFSPDGKLLVGGTDEGMQTWGVLDGKSIGGTVRVTDGLVAAAWLPGTMQLAVAGKTGAVKLWAVPNGASQWPGSVNDVPGLAAPATALGAVSTNRSWLLIGDAEGRVRLWDLAKTNAIRELKHGAPVTSVAASPDGRRFASAGGGPIARLWDAADGKQVAELKGDRRAYERVAAQEAFFNFANAETNYHKTTIQNIEKAQQAVAERVKKATETLATATKTFEEKFATNKTTAEAKATADKDLMPLVETISKATNALSAAERDQKNAEAELKQFKEKTPSDKAGIEKLETALAAKTKITTEAKAIADKTNNELKDKLKQATDKVTATTKAATEADAALKKAEMAKAQAENELNLANGAAKKEEANLAAAKAAQERADEVRQKAEIDLQALRKAAGETEKTIKTVAFTSEGLITTGDDGLIHIWNAYAGTAYEVFGNGSGALAALPAGLIVTPGSAGKANILSTKPAWVLERVIGGDAASPFADRVNALTFSTDGKWLATGGGEPSRSSEIHIWETATGKQAYAFRNIHSDAVLSLDFSPDLRYLASGGADRFARVVEIATGKAVKVFEGHTHHVQGVSWKADGRMLATAGADNQVKLWDFVTGERRRNIAGFEKEVTSVNFIGYTDQMVATSGDPKVRLLREDGNEVRSFPGSADFMTSSAVTPDGRVVVAGGYDGVLRVWKIGGEVLAVFPPSARENLNPLLNARAKR